MRFFFSFYILLQKINDFFNYSCYDSHIIPLWKKKGGISYVSRLCKYASPSQKKDKAQSLKGWLLRRLKKTHHITANPLSPLLRFFMTSQLCRYTFWCQKVIHTKVWFDKKKHSNNNTWLFISPVSFKRIV